MRNRTIFGRRIRSIQGSRIVIYVLLLLLAGVGCDQRKRAAKQRVVDALNPVGMSVTNGQCVVLNLQTGYVAFVPEHRAPKEFVYAAFFSSTGDFSHPELILQDTNGGGERWVEILGRRVLIGWGGQNATDVVLDSDDKQTGIALSPTNDLQHLRASRLKFAYGKPLSLEDLRDSMPVRQVRYVVGTKPTTSVWAAGDE